MSCRQISLDLYIDLTQAASHEAAQRVAQVLEACSFAHNLALRIHPTSCAQHEADSRPARQLLAAAREAEREAEVAFALLRAYAEAQMGHPTAETIAQIAQQHGIAPSSLSAHAPLLEAPLLPEASRRAVTERQHHEPTPLLSVGRHVWLHGACSAAQYRAAVNQLYDIWVECGAAQGLHEDVFPL